jgi:hypothetical protein
MVGLSNGVKNIPRIEEEAEVDPICGNRSGNELFFI